MSDSVLDVSDPEQVRRLLAELDARAAAAGIAELWDPSPELEHVYRSIVDELESVCPDFSGEIAEDFSVLLQKTVKFVASRLDVDRQEESGLDYLFASDQEQPHEEELAKDYRRFFVSSDLSRASFYTEVRPLAHGRVDVLLIFPSRRFVAELKRELEDASRGALSENYAAQAVAYQVTDIPLGLVIVLDLTRTGVGPPHLRDCIWVETVPPPDGETVQRTLVFARVPGNQQAPSSL